MRLFIFSHPRTASNLWLKLLESHPALASDLDTPFLHAFKYGPERMQLRDQGQGAENRFQEHSHESFQFCYDKMMKFIEDTEREGRIPMVKEHTQHIMDSGIVARNSNEIVERAFGNQDDLASKFKRRVVSNGKIVDEAGNSAYLEHDCPFLIPRSFINTVTPIFMIRHPARYIPSYYRAGQGTGMAIDDVDMPVNSSMKWNRIAFDYFAKTVCGGDTSHSQYPIVVDGDDLCDDTKGVMRRFCSRVDIEESGVKYQWDALPADKFEEVRPPDQAFFGNSSIVDTNPAILKSNMGTPNIKKEEEKWEADWGSNIANKLRIYTEGALADYEYLKQQKI